MLSFGIEGKEKEAVVQFCKEHRHSHGEVGAIGGSFTYSFTPTTIGTAVVVKCVCGAELNATDYEAW